jgi:hypothetical protein
VVKSPRGSPSVASRQLPQRGSICSAWLLPSGGGGPEGRRGLRALQPQSVWSSISASGPFFLIDSMAFLAEAFEA